MSIFIGNLIGFAVIALIIIKWVVPLVKGMMLKQQEAIRVALAESAEAAKKLDDADAMHAKALEDARSESTKVTDEAKQDSERIAEQLEEQAGVDAERIKAQGTQQVQLMRQQLIRQLRTGLGSEAVAKAGDLVRAHVADATAQAATVDRFLDELDQMAPSSAVVEPSSTANLRAASREARVALATAFDAGTSDASDLETVASELASVVSLLVAQTTLTKHLAEPADKATAKVALVDRLFSERVAEQTLELLRVAVSQRWSAESDLVDGVEFVARLALLRRAEVGDDVGDVEEQLFRFGRVLDAEPHLAGVLSDPSAPAQRRVALLEKVLGDGANATATALISQTVTLLRGERADKAVADLAELAVARRGEVVAHITAAAELTDAQRTRLTRVLTRIYGQPASIQLHVDPELLGGLTVTVGDEVIDGSIASRLAAAQSQLPD